MGFRDVIKQTVLELYGYPEADVGALRTEGETPQGVQEHSQPY